MVSKGVPKRSAQWKLLVHGMNSLLYWSDENKESRLVRGDFQMLTQGLLMPKTNNGLFYFAIASLLAVSLAGIIKGEWLRFQFDENTYMQIGKEVLNTQ
ncbi:MAG: hypothetical protein AB8B99_18855 [Phormidesmis sp.]